MLGTPRRAAVVILRVLLVLYYGFGAWKFYRLLVAFIGIPVYCALAAFFFWLVVALAAFDRLKGKRYPELVEAALWVAKACFALLFAAQIHSPNIWVAGGLLLFADWLAALLATWLERFGNQDDLKNDPQHSGGSPDSFGVDIPQIKTPLTVELQEEPFGGLVDVWLFLSAGSAFVLAICGVLVWSTAAAPRGGLAWWVLFLKTAVGGTTELRFFLGHRNYLQSVVREHNSIDILRWQRARWDFLLMCLITTFKLTMSIELSDSAAFINGFLCLMLSDLLWLCFEPRVRSVANIKSFKPCRWMWINLATAVLILLGSRVQAVHGVELCAIGTVWQLLIAATNCFMDLCCCSGPVCANRPD